MSGIVQLPFVALVTANTAVPWSSLAVTSDAFCLYGYALALYRWQGP